MEQAAAVPQVPAAQVPDGAMLLDVREADEWDAGHVPGAQHIPLGELAARFREIGHTGPLYVICRSGHRSAHAATALAGVGLDTHNVCDGMIGWHRAGRPMASESSGAPYVA